MNDTVHQFLQVLLQGITWVVRTIEALWAWSWSQITSVFSMSWDNLPGWKLALGLVAVGVLIAIFVIIAKRAVAAFSRIAAAFWTIGMTLVGVLTFVVVAGLFSRGFTWVVASVPDDFWQKLL
jgi:hypothetical protein